MRIASPSIQREHVVSLYGDEYTSRVAAVRTRMVHQYGVDVGQAEIVIRHALPLHSGLGAGTQLASAVAAGLTVYRELPEEAPSPQEGWQAIEGALPNARPDWLAERCGRGLRSAVGLHGFLHGGLILDRGCGLPTEGTDRTYSTHSVRLPSEWRLVLIRPKCGDAVSGSQEAKLLEEIGETRNPHSQHMLELAEQAIDLADQNANFDAFTEVLDTYMLLAARLFERHQGGLYNGPQVAAAVDAARRAGLQAVGQSSWGPCVFGFAPDAATAERCSSQLTAQPALSEYLIAVAKPLNQGAQWRPLASVR